jgi:UDP-N-acetylmuramoyl-L-alanyl-D-glutamate--2,6-diaminopimelate ligase
VTTARDLARVLPEALVVGDPDAPAGAITHDSRRVVPGSVFVAVPGAAFDGHRFAPDAVAAGASVVVLERALDLPVTQLVVPDARAALGPLSCVVHGDPSRHLRVVGVTGTNGKTTVTHLLAAVFERAGERTHVMGTLSGARTTPEAPDLQAELADARRRGVLTVAMEVSSHALALDRVAGTHFAAAVFTNLGRDHLDFHRTVEAYFAAKAQLFTPAYTGLGIVNLDQPHGRLLRDAAEIEIRGYQLADAEDLEVRGVMSRFVWRGHEILLRLPGVHNVANALAAAAAAEALGVPADVVADGLSGAEGVRGRFELIDLGQPFRVAVDYAHTPDALGAALSAARSLTEQRILVVFGCGGERDREKRPQMGRIAEQAADVVVVTSDNPRGEDPSAIAAAILEGMTDPTAAVVELDRRAAIARAVALARPGDLVVVAGKGHETYQELDGRTVAFDDRQVAVELLLEGGDR